MGMGIRMLVWGDGGEHDSEAEGEDSSARGESMQLYVASSLYRTFGVGCRSLRSYGMR